MTQKQMAWKVKGMNQDLSVSAFNPEFAFENHNLRLSTNENNTTLSWVNEKGTSELNMDIDITPWEETDDNKIFSAILTGTPVGTAVINDKLIVFTAGNKDRIYVLRYNADQSAITGSCMYCGNLGFDIEHPLETLVSYESSAIEKVYWTDGINQPRVINIAANKEKIIKWNHVGSSTSAIDTFFDFVPCIQLKESVNIEKISGGGTFAPGTIQYCFTYINKYQQQSNIVYQSSLYYLTHDDRGASPEDKVSNSFRITIKNPDTNFDYIRLYLVQRTSVNDVPFVKLISDIPVGSGDVTYLDNGTTGSAMDPTELLYVGGKEIHALTMAAKDQTLFLGNLVEMNSSVDSLQDWADNLRENGNENNGINISFHCDDTKSYNIEKPTGTYGKSFTLNRNQRQITTFKGGENYRFGFQLQKKTGEWSQPVYLDDVTNRLYPSATDENVKLVYAQTTLHFPSDTFSQMLQDYRRIRPVVVFPNMNDRRVLCQGVLNPTVFNIYNRVKNQPFAQASWFFRPMYNPSIAGIDDGSRAEDNPHVIVDSSKYRVYADYVGAEYLKGAGLAGSYYILVGNLQGSKDQIDAVLGKQIHYKVNENDTATNENYLFYIYLGKGKARDGSILENQYTYAFIRKEDDDSSTDLSWPGTESQEGYATGYYSIGSTSVMDFVAGSVYVCKFERINRFGQAGYLSSDNAMGEAYYDVEHGGLLSVTLQFCHKAPLINPGATNWSESDGWKYYSVTFINQAWVDDSDEPDVVVNSDGSNVVFQHYGSLPSSIDGIKSVEVQGAENRYLTPYDSADDKPLEEARSNNQFFVDQSIVTLNSPDIEFDTAVQTWGTEDLRLRIVGVVPIHASISSHSITTKGSMLSLGDNDDVDKTKYGVGERSYNVVHNYKDMLAGRRLVADYLWNDAYISDYTPKDDGKDIIERQDEAVNYLVYPWHKTGSLINDPRSIADAASVLETKKEASFFFSGNTEYLSNFKDYNIHAAIHLTENSYVHNIRLSKQLDTLESELNYYPNVDCVLYNENKYPMYAKGVATTSVNDPVAMKYLSTSHAVIALVPEPEDVSSGNGDVPVLPSASSVPSTIYSHGGGNNKTLWNDIISFKQDSIVTPSIVYHFLWLGELYREPSNPFGGDTREAIRANTWIVGGDSIDLNPSNFNPEVTLKWTEGDTYYQRYDCLKTYPMSPMDTNQLVEILSFMCETRTNIDGRYDKNRGQKDNTEMTPQNFNLLNPAYTQQNNFFNYRQLDNEANRNLEYPNQIYFTKTKTSGADVDLWTNINLGSTLELEGDKGAISKLVKFNDTLLAFQERGISQILYNENVQVASTTGVPIEIANSGKVQGARYISDNVGCSNKWSVVNTASGVYFIDSSNKAIYLFNGQLNNITLTKGMNTWAKRNIGAVDDVWYPGTESNAFVSYYDKLNNDVLFINKDKALAFSEKMDAFTSFYDYGDTPYFVNFKDTGIWIRNNGTLWKHQGGEYCKFFDEQKPYWMQLVGNAEPNLDKIFTNLEFRATVDGDGDVDDNNRFIPLLPFDKIEVWNEYQHGITSLENWNKNNYGMWHYIRDDVSALNRKFRIWRCDIPRDTAPTTSDVGMNISRKAPHPLNRIRNPWIYLKLYKDKDTSSRTEIHDMVMTYYL